MEIYIKTIPHKRQRYETPGDYFTDENDVDHILVSDMGNSRMEFLCALHEMIEQRLCRLRGISERKITAFDKKFEKERVKGRHGKYDEPGDDPRAPYRKEHQFATMLEMMMAQKMRVDWGKYSEIVAEL